MKPVNVRHCWLQENLWNGNYKVKRVDRMFNASDMLALSPSTEELRKFLPMIGCHTMAVKKVNFNAVQKMLKRMRAAKITALLATVAGTLNS